jgi:hypothetical protein
MLGDAKWAIHRWEHERPMLCQPQEVIVGKNPRLQWREALTLLACPESCIAADDQCHAREVKFHATLLAKYADFDQV